MTAATSVGADVVLAIKELTYGTPQGCPLVEGISFVLKKGDVGLVTGPNGIGKSTLLKIILGTHPTLAGSVELIVPPKLVAYLPQMQNKTFHIPLLLREVIDFARSEGRSGKAKGSPDYDSFIPECADPFG